MIRRVSSVVGVGMLLMSIMAGSVTAAEPGDWRQFRGGADRRAVNSYETQITRANVASLELQWVGNSGFNSSPAVVDGVVYISNGGIHAYPAACGTGGATCSPLWRGNSGYANWSSPAVSGGVVYIGGHNGLFAYRVGCRSDGGVCAPLWRGTASPSAFTSPGVADGRVYVLRDDGILEAYNTKFCANQGGTCQPRWTANVHGHAQSSPAIANGMVYVGGGDGHLYAFRVDCATGGAACQPVWKGPIGGGTVSTPAVAGGTVYIGAYNGQFFAFPTSCRNTGPSCSPLWKAALPDGVIVHTSPAVTDTAVYFGAGRRMYAFPVGCRNDGGECNPLWRSVESGAGGIFGSSPAVANGMVFVGTQANNQSNGRVLAFRTHCGTGGATCYPIWRSPFTGGIVNASPAVSDGMVFVASNSGRTFAFGLP